jgi:hypothetical protein
LSKFGDSLPSRVCDGFSVGTGDGKLGGSDGTAGGASEGTFEGSSNSLSTLTLSFAAMSKNTSRTQSHSRVSDCEILPQKVDPTKFKTSRGAASPSLYWSSTCSLRLTKVSVAGAAKELLEGATDGNASTTQSVPFVTLFIRNKGSKGWQPAQCIVQSKGHLRRSPNSSSNPA